MDLSTGGKIDEIRQAIIDASPVPIGTVPIYQIIQNVKDPADITPKMMLDMVEHQAQQGVDYMFGIVGFPVEAKSRRILRDWRRMNVAARFKSRDQGNLIALLLRKYFGQWAYIEDATFGRRVQRYDQTLVHFTGPGHLNMAPYYEQILQLDPVNP